MLIFLLELWNWEVAPIPICIAILLYFIPVYWRKYRSDVYTPLYFAFYPLSKLNVPLSRYLGQSYIDDYIDDNDAEREKKIIKIKSIFSSMFYVILIPFFLAFTWSFFLIESQFILSSLIILISVIIMFTKSVIRFNTVSSRRGLLSFFYAGVIFVFFYILFRAHYWITPFIEAKEYGGIFINIGDFIIMEGVISLLVVGVLIPIIISLSFDRKVRQSNIENQQSWQQSATSYDVAIEEGNKEESSTCSDHYRWKWISPTFYTTYRIFFLLLLFVVYEK